MRRKERQGHAGSSAFSPPLSNLATGTESVEIVIEPGSRQAGRRVRDLPLPTGPDEPYDKLKRALRAEAYEDAWAALYNTTRRPFACPASGKISVKVIDHYGDEVLKVFEVQRAG